MFSNSSSEAYKYTTIRYLIDPDRNIDVPVGVVLCNADRGNLFFRLPAEYERIPHVPTATAKASLQLAQSKIEYWLRTGAVPYASERIAPLSEAWWDQVRKLMQFRVRIGPVQPIDCRRPEEEIETLYEAIVKPQVSPQAHSLRVNGAVTRALGDMLAAHLPYGMPVAGFGDRPITVLRHAEDARRMVVVEAVNLAACTAEKDTYALMSKLRSIRYRMETARKRTYFVVGYLASPAGLNGEANLKAWFEHDIGVQMHDLTREQEQFRTDVSHALAEINDELSILQGTTQLRGE